MAKTPRSVVIAIDGPAGAGKSTVAKRLARTLEFLYVDTGAIYRCVALRAREKGVVSKTFSQGSAEDKNLRSGALDDELRKILPEMNHIAFSWQGEQIQVQLEGRDVSQLIREDANSQAASSISSRPLVRDALLDFQRKFAKKGNVVLEGRDIGTVVFPQAQVKVFLTAKAEIRARRRYEELQSAGKNPDLQDIVRSIEERDRQDREREIAPLKPAPDAHEVDSTDLSIPEVLDRILKWVS